MVSPARRRHSDQLFSRRSALRALALALCLSLGGCSEENDTVLIDIGTTRVLFTSPGLGPQTIKDADRPLQAVAWQVTQATLTVDGRPIDLLAGSDCMIVQTADSIFPTSEERCSGGIVVDSRDEMVKATVDVVFTMSVARGEPVLLGGDYDADGIADSQDNCPLIPNPDQDIAVCSIIDTFSGAFFSDSDGDSVIDGLDNCLWTPNESQEDSGGIVSGTIRDAIGDECVEQVADVMLDGSTEIRLLGVPVTYTQPRNAPSFVVIAINHFEALSCDYTAGTCELNRDAVGICVQTNQTSAVIGCTPLEEL